MSTPSVLNRTLGLPSLVLLGLAYMTPIIVLGIFGVIAEISSGASSSAYLFALVVMLFTAHSYGRMAVAYPTSGSAYTYVRRSIDSRAGFLVGWAVLLDYLFLPMVIWLIGGAYLQAQFPGVLPAVWILLFIVITSVINALGIRVADRANFALMAFQVLVVAAFVALSIGTVVASEGAGGLISTGPFVGDGAGLAGITAGAAVAAYSFLGFDAVTTFAEEAKDPKRTMPRAILLVALIGGAIFVLVSYTTQLVRPGGVFEDSGSAAFDIAITIGGNVFGAIFLAGLVVAQFASGLSAQAAGSRLLYVMGRDGVLPKRIFGQLNEQFRTPVGSLIVIGIVGLLALVLDITTSTSFINFGAFLAFTAVNIAVIAYYLRRRMEGTRLNVFSYVVIPAIGAVVTIFLLTRLDANALTLGAIWLAVGVIVLAIVTRGFRVPPPEASFEEVEAATQPATER